MRQESRSEGFKSTACTIMLTMCVLAAYLLAAGGAVVA
jgi:hypothetical protein